MLRRSRLSTILAIGAAAVLSGVAGGQAPDSQAPPPPPAATRHVVARTIFGDAGLIVNARSDGFIEVAAAGSKKTIMLKLPTLAARAWVDSAGRMLRARPRRSNTPRTYRANIEEPGTSGTMALRRQVTQGVSEYSLFFSDDPLDGITVAIEQSEANVFVATIRRAVAQSAKMMEKTNSAATTDDSSAKARPKATPPRRRPAGARSTKPPADTSAKGAAKAPAKTPPPAPQPKPNTKPATKP